MVIPFAVSSYNIIVARTFNNSIPWMWEAKIDGCGTPVGLIVVLIVAIAVIGPLTAAGIWNSYRRT